MVAEENGYRAEHVGAPNPGPAVLSDVATCSVSVRGSVAFDLVLPSDSSDPVIEAYRREEPLNEYLVELLRRLLPRPGTVLDLGCHVGTFALAAAALGHRVIAVDASAVHVELVRSSAELNGFEGLVAIHSAISDRPGLVRFDEQGLFGHVIEDPKAGTEVRAATVLEILSEADCRPESVDLIKMDIEGCELRALQGAADWLSDPSAPPILYESNPRTAAPLGYSTEGLRLALEELGYHSYRPEPDGLFLCPPDEPQPEAWVDLLALKGGQESSVRLGTREPLPRARLLAKFSDWSRDPNAEVRRYTAEELNSHWREFRWTREGRRIRRRLARSH